MFPYEVIPLKKTINAKMMTHFIGAKSGFVQVGPQKYIFPAKYDQYKESYYELEPRAEDVWVMTFPRSGTTLTQEIVWLLINNLDYETAARVPLDDRFPFLGYNTVVDDKVLDELFELNGRTDEIKRIISEVKTPTSELLKLAASPRLIKTHLPFSLVHPNLVETSRVVYVARNPKDVAVSCFHHAQRFNSIGFDGDFETYWTYFEDGLVPWGPHWEHIKEGYERRNHKNVLFLFYEDFIKDIKGSIKKISEFLSKPISGDDLDKLCNYTQIDNFRQNINLKMSRYKLKGFVNEGSQDFIRKGKIGENPEFSDALTKRADAWIQKKLSQYTTHFPL